MDETAISFEITKQDDTRLPEVIRVTFTNRSGETGAFELPGPRAGTAQGAYATPAIAIFVASGQALESDASSFGSDEWIERHAEDEDHKGLLFLRSPAKSGWPKNASIVILAANEKYSVEYPTDEFCMTGHGIEPRDVANFRKLYKSGEVKTGMQVWLLWNDIEKFERTVSNVITVSLTEPDMSKIPVDEPSETVGTDQ